MPSKSPGAGANPGGFIARAIQTGASKTQALREFRSVGGGMRTQRWYQLWNTVEGAIGRAGEIAQLPANRIPGEDMFTQWGTARPGKFAYQVNVQVYDTDSDSFINSPSMVTYDRRVSPAKAIRDVMERVDEAFNGEGEYAGYKVQSATLGGMYQTVPIIELDE